MERAKLANLSLALKGEELKTLLKFYLIQSLWTKSASRRPQHRLKPDAEPPFAIPQPLIPPRRRPSRSIRFGRRMYRRPVPPFVLHPRLAICTRSCA